MQELFKRLLEFTNDGVYRYAFDDGQILFANRGLVDILDLEGEPEALAGRHLRDLFQYTEREGAVRHAMEAAGGEVHGFEYHFRTLRGTDKWVLHDSFITIDPDSGKRVVEAIVKDITVRKLAERALQASNELLEQRVRERTTELETSLRELEREVRQRRRAEASLAATVRELERSNQELAQFAYVASHDLQEPLRMVTSYLQLLERRYTEQLDNDAHEFIGYAVGGARHMKELINDLLEYSRVGSRAEPLQPVDLEEVFRRALAHLAPSIEELGARVTRDPLPTALADDSQLEQVFLNLLSNALKFRGPAAPRIHVSARRLDGTWRFSVADNGIGIEAQFFERIFVLFQRLHTREHYPGTGIGLAICKKIVERHGGRIWVESEPGKGTTFHFTLHAADGGDHEQDGLGGPG
jgi:PAS domain S-box-containing protein